MKACLKSNFKLNKSKKEFRKSKCIYRTESIDILAKNMVGNMPFVSKYVKQKYNKYILNKHKDRLININNFLNKSNKQKDLLAQIFDTLNLVRIKIRILEKDLQAYNITKKRDPKDKNYFIKKIIQKKYAKLRKFDAYQNLLLAKIYEQSILGNKLKNYEIEAKRQSSLIEKRFNQPDELKKLQKKFIYSLIYDRQKEDKIFVEDVNIEDFMDIMVNDPLFDSAISNLETFTYNFLHKNKGALSKSFVKFQSNNANSNISEVVKNYLDLYLKKYPESTSEKLDEIQKSLLKGFNYETFRDSEIFSDYNTEISLNDIIMKAKINFTKSQICQELEYCLENPEINNYFKIISAKDDIKNYAISRERVFVERIEKEFEEIKSSSFVYLYNDIKETLDTYRREITESEMFFVRDFIEAVMYYELEDTTNEKEIQEILDDVRIGIYKNPKTYTVKNNMDLYFKIFTILNYYVSYHMISFKDIIKDTKLYHGILVTKDLKPIIPLEIQKNILNLSIDAQIELAKNNFYSNLLNNLDECCFSTSGDIYKPNKKPVFRNYTKPAIRNLTLNTEIIYVGNYININSKFPEFKNEVETAKYILDGLKDTLKDSIAEMVNIRTKEETNNNDEIDELINDSINIDDDQFDEENLDDDTLDENELDTDIVNPINNESNFTENETLEEDDNVIQAEELELASFKKAEKYIKLILEESDSSKQISMLSKLQKRINSNDLMLSEVSIENSNKSLEKLNLTLKTPKQYVDSLVEKYKSEKRDIKGLEVGLKLRVRMGSLILTDEEINKINEDYDFNIIQRSKISYERIKNNLKLKYFSKIKPRIEFKEKLLHPEALVRKTFKSKNSKLVGLDFRLFKIMEDKYY